MLLSLNLTNYIFIESLELDFKQGFVILTGETGAGKSIIVDAIEIVLGDKMNVSFIQKDKPHCEITGVFSIKDKELLRIFELEGAEVIIRRRIDRQGKSKCYVNDRVVSLASVKQLGRYLIDIHGQHSHQLLLDANEQRNIIDRFGNLMDMRAKVAEMYREKKLVLQQLETLVSRKNQVKEQADFFAFQKEEIERINPKEGEDKQLEEELMLLMHRDKLMQMVSSISLDLSEEEGSVFSRLGRVTKQLTSLGEYQKNYTALAEEASRCQDVLEDINGQVSSFTEQLEFDTNRLDEVTSRIEKLDRIKKKYGLTIQDVLKRKDEAANLLASISGDDGKEEQLKKKIADIEAHLNGQANQLSIGRKKAAQKLEKLIEVQLKDLDMKQVSLNIDIKPISGADDNIVIEETGKDHVEFLVRTNVGASYKPLKEIISGGELSRVMLALKASMAQYDKVSVLVFDEVDTGLGGKAAFVVGKKLYNVSRSHQVICITHLPQVAVFADEHFLVSKKIDNKITKTVVESLSKTNRMQEIGRMVGGNVITDSALVHAKEMVTLAGKEKQGGYL